MLIGILGRLGGYKSTWMTALVRENLIDNINVASNYWMDWEGTEQKDFVPLLSFEEKRETKAIDEAYGIAESRISGSKLNRFTSYFVFQSRKLTEEYGADVIWSAQLDSSVDKRWFLLTPMKYACYGLVDGKCEFDVLYNGHLIPFTIPIWWFEQNIFGHFNSYKTVPPVGIEELILEMEQHDFATMNDTLDKLCDDILKAYGWDNTNFPQKLKESDVRDILRRMCKTTTLAKSVCDRLNNPYKPLEVIPKHTCDGLGI